MHGRPVPRWFHEGYAIHAGGKGANQALAARGAGAGVAMFGAVGADAFADAAPGLGRSLSSGRIVHSAARLRYKVGQPVRETFRMPASASASTVR